MIRLIWILAFTVLIQGCATQPIISADVDTRHLIGQFVLASQVRKAQFNRYALIIRGRVYERSDFFMTSLRDLQTSIPSPDQYVDEDVDQLTRLLTNKGFDVYYLDFHRAAMIDLYRWFEKMAEYSDDNTQTAVVYSGEGDNTGLRPAILQVNGMNICPPDSTISPHTLFGLFGKVHGSHLLLINACQSGIFADAAHLPWFRGVVIAACPEGYYTTPHEPAGTTAVMASFLELYRDRWRQTDEKLDLAVDHPTVAGGFWTNLLHHMILLFSYKKLSYDLVVRVTKSFRL